MRLETDYINVHEIIEQTNFSELDIMLDTIDDRVKFEYNFFDLQCDDEFAKTLTPSDGDIQIMVELYLKGMPQGEQEFWYENKDEKEESARLTWKVSNSFSYH